MLEILKQSANASESLAFAQREIRRQLRLTERWTDMKPHPMQASYFWHPARFKINPSGRRSGKTELAKRKGVMELTRRRQWPTKILYGAPSFGQAKDIFWRDLNELIPQHWIASVNKTDLEITTRWGATVRVMGFDRPRRMEGVPWDWCFIDELADCFIRGTLVSTPLGPRPIESISVGDRVLCAGGIGIVTHTRIRHKNSLAVVELSEGCLVSSPDHRYLTRRGWVRAGELGVGDELIEHQETLRIMRRGLRGEECRPLSKSTDMRGAVPSQDRLSETIEAGKDVQEGMRQLPQAFHEPRSSPADLFAVLHAEMDGSHQSKESSYAWPDSECRTGSTEDESLDVYAEGPSSLEPRPTEDGASSDRAWRQRPSDSDSAANDLRFARGWIPDGVCSADRKPAGQGWPTHALQDRYCERRCKGGNRDRRIESQQPERSGSGSTEVRDSGRARVVRVTVHKCGSDEFRRFGGQEDTITLHDLSVAGHPSFCVQPSYLGASIVAHNCPRGCFAYNIRPALSTLGREGKCDLLGVPDEVGRNQAEYEQLWERGLLWQPGLPPGWPNAGDKAAWDPNLCSFHWPSADIIDPTELASLKSSYDELAFDQEFGGKFVSSGGKAVPRFDFKTHVREEFCAYDPTLPLDWSLDFGTAPAASLLCQAYKGSIWILDEIVIKDSSTDVAADEMFRRANNRGYSLRRLRVFGDAAGASPHSNVGTSDYEILEEKLRGLPRVEWLQLTHAPLVKDGLNSVRARVCSADRKVRLHIHPRCTNLIKDLKTASWPDGSNNLRTYHCLAALRYYCFALFGEGEPTFDVAPMHHPNLGGGDRKPGGRS